LSRAALYDQPVEVSPGELKLMALIDRQYLRTPFYGSRRMTAWLQTQGHLIATQRHNNEALNPGRILYLKIGRSLS